MWNASWSSLMPGASVAALDDDLHQPASDAGVLAARVDRDRPDSADRAALVEEVRADDAAIVLRHHSPAPTGAAIQLLHHLLGGLERRGKSRSKRVMVVDPAERVEDDLRRDAV